MTFLSEAQSNRPISGNPEAKILIVGDYPDEWALKAGKPFAHANETVLQTALHHAGLTTYEVLTTNLLYDTMNISHYWRETAKKDIGKLTSSINEYKISLLELIQLHKPTVIVAMGGLTTYAFTGRSEVNKVRGYPFKTEAHGFIVVPTLHPRKMIWTNYEWRYYLAHDLKKVRQIAEKPDILNDPREIILPENFNHAIQLLTELNNSVHHPLSIDIEVDNFEISCIGFAQDAKSGIVIPFDMRWTEYEEVKLWKLTTKVLENDKIAKIGQNFIFDIHFLAQKMGIFIKPINGDYIQDTMIAHHIMYPDFLKGLNFLGSIHSYQPYWKDELDFKTIKKES